MKSPKAARITSSLAAIPVILHTTLHPSEDLPVGRMGLVLCSYFLSSFLSRLCYVVDIHLGFIRTQYSSVEPGPKGNVDFKELEGHDHAKTRDLMKTQVSQEAMTSASAQVSGNLMTW